VSRGCYADVVQLGLVEGALLLKEKVVEHELRL
jgi:hypothetical protein